MRRLLWGINGLLGIGIVAFAAWHLMFPETLDRLADVDRTAALSSPPSPPGTKADEAVLLTLCNPLRQAAAQPPTPFAGFTLKGALSAPSRWPAVAFMRAASRPVDLMARMGEDVLQDGKPAPEFAGLRLSEVWKDRAVFVHWSGERYEVRIESLPRPDDPPAVESYRTEGFKSRLLASSETREVWGMDDAEAAWIGRNAAALLERDVRLTPIPGRGLLIEAIATGSTGASRGLKAGDLLREVNGRPIHSLNDLHLLLADPPKSDLRLGLERNGRPCLIEYHPLPR